VPPIQRLRGKPSPGFTLIEVVVVIAIIGILAAIVIVSFATSREKAYDARVKMIVDQLRTLGEVYYHSNNFSFNGYDICLNDPSEANCPGSLASAVSSLVSELGGSQGGPPVSNATASEFCVSAALASDSERSFCKDSAGHAGLTDTATVCSSTACIPSGG
jgi:prepilin-type N-terminal cleavage/methylation domain-containing protein